MAEINEIRERLLERVATRADALASVIEGPAALTRFANSAIHQNVAEDDRSVYLKVAVGGRTAAATTTRSDDEGLAALVERTLAAAALRPPDPDWPGMAPPSAAADTEHWDDETANASPDDRAAVVASFVREGAGLDAAGYCATSARRIAMANSAGQRVESRATTATVSGIHRTASSDGLGLQSSVRLADIDGSALGATAADKARRGEGATDVPPGSYEVVLEPSCIANMLLFLGNAGFNGKAHADGTSFVHLGDQQFDASILLWDDATDPRTTGFVVDNEATPKRRVDLVRDGVAVGLVHDRRSAAKAGTESTGHSVGLEAFGAFPSNMFLGGGTGSADDLVSNVDNGLLVTDFWYTRILDPKTQVVTGLTRNGVFRIERGEVTGAVSNLRFTQSFVGALGPGRIKGIADDARLVNGMHVPTIHLAAWNFTGGSAG